MILDTNALSDWWDGCTPLVELLSTFSQVYIPLPALAEFRFGILQSRKREEMQLWLDRAIASTIILQVDETTTSHYADLRLILKRAGNPIPMNDLWIAAIARQHRLALVSRDTHFDVVPDLTRLSW